MGISISRYVIDLIITVHLICLLSTMTLFSVLTCFATLSTGLTLLIKCASLIAQQLGQDKLMICLYNVHCWLIPIDCVVNSICLYLMLEVNHRKYAIICGKCDEHITNSCQKLAKRVIIRNYVSIQDKDDNIGPTDVGRSSALLRLSNSSTPLIPHSI